jgi:hypothetical protein
MTRLLGNAKALMLRGHGAVVVGQSIREVCMLALFLEESARLQTEAMKRYANVHGARGSREDRQAHFQACVHRAGLGSLCRETRQLIFPGLLVFSQDFGLASSRLIFLLPYLG